MKTMRRVAILAMPYAFLAYLLCFACPTSLNAQGASYTGTPIALTRGGFPAAGATVTVCAGSVAFNVTASPPCTPNASIYSDPLLSILITQPGFTTDGLGNYPFFVTGGASYTVCLTGSGLTGQCTVWAAPVNGSIANTFPALQTFSAGISSDGVHAELIPATNSTLMDLASNQTVTGTKTFSAGISSDGVHAELIPATNSTLMDLATNQTLQNKALTGALNGNSVTLLNFQGPLAPITGTSSAAVYYTFSLPANTLAIAKGIRIVAISKHTTGTASIAFHCTFGGTVLDAFGNVAGASNVFTRHTVELFNVGSTSVQSAASTISSTDTNSFFNTYGTAAIATTSSVAINVTFTVANTDAITPEMFWVELIQ